jgi:hypothetical protein
VVPFAALQVVPFSALRAVSFQRYYQLNKVMETKNQINAMKSSQMGHVTVNRKRCDLVPAFRVTDDNN